MRFFFLNLLCFFFFSWIRIEIFCYPSMIAPRRRTMVDRVKRHAAKPCAPGDGRGDGVFDNKIVIKRSLHALYNSVFFSLASPASPKPPPTPGTARIRPLRRYDALQWRTSVRRWFLLAFVENPRNIAFRRKHAYPPRTHWNNDENNNRVFVRLNVSREIPYAPKRVNPDYPPCTCIARQRRYDATLRGVRCTPRRRKIGWR